MPELPNLLRQRLAATETGETQAHPDADTLTAYMEQSLPPAESKTVVAHLAVCEPCREVVALSQAVMAQPETQTVLAPAPVARWRRLFTPVFGAVGAVAAMAVIAVMVLQLPQKNPQQGSTGATTNSAANSPAPQPAQETQQAKAASAVDQVAPAEPKAAAPLQQADTRVTAARADLATARETEARLDDSGKAKAAKKPAQVASTMGVVPASPAKAPVLTAALAKKDYVNTNFFSANGADKIAVDSQGNNLPAAPQPQPGAANAPFNHYSKQQDHDFRGFACECRRQFECPIADSAASAGTSGMHHLQDRTINGAYSGVPCASKNSGTARGRARQQRFRWSGDVQRSHRKEPAFRDFSSAGKGRDRQPGGFKFAQRRSNGLSIRRFRNANVENSERQADEIQRPGPVGRRLPNRQQRHGIFCCECARE